MSYESPTLKYPDPKISTLPKDHYYFFRNKPSIGMYPSGEVMKELWDKAQVTQKGNMAYGWVAYREELSPDALKEFDLFIDEAEAEDHEKAKLYLSAISRFTLNELREQEATVRRWSIRFPYMEKELEDEFKLYIELRQAEKASTEATRKEKAGKPQSELAKDLYKQMRKINDYKELNDWRNRVLWNTKFTDEGEKILMFGLADQWQIYLETRGVPASEAFDKLGADLKDDQYYFGTEVTIHPRTDYITDQPQTGKIHYSQNQGELFEIRVVGIGGLFRVPIERIYVTKLVEKLQKEPSEKLKEATPILKKAFDAWYESGGTLWSDYAGDMLESALKRTSYVKKYGQADYNEILQDVQKLGYKNLKEWYEAISGKTILTEKPEEKPKFVIEKPFGVDLSKSVVPYPELWVYTHDKSLKGENVFGQGVTKFPLSGRYEAYNLFLKYSELAGKYGKPYISLYGLNKTVPDFDGGVSKYEAKYGGYAGIFSWERMFNEWVEEHTGIKKTVMISPTQKEAENILGIDFGKYDIYGYGTRVKSQKKTGDVFTEDAILISKHLTPDEMAKVKPFLKSGSSPVIEAKTSKITPKEPLQLRNRVDGIELVVGTKTYLVRHLEAKGFIETTDYYTRLYHQPYNATVPPFHQDYDRILNYFIKNNFVPVKPLPIVPDTTSADYKAGYDLGIQGRIAPAVVSWHDQGQVDHAAGYAEGKKVFETKNKENIIVLPREGDTQSYPYAAKVVGVSENKAWTEVQPIFDDTKKIKVLTSRIRELTQEDDRPIFGQPIKKPPVTFEPIFAPTQKKLFTGETKEEQTAQMQFKAPELKEAKVIQTREEKHRRERLKEVPKRKEFGLEAFGVQKPGIKGLSEFGNVESEFFSEMKEKAKTKQVGVERSEQFRLSISKIKEIAGTIQVNYKLPNLYLGGSQSPKAIHFPTRDSDIDLTSYMWISDYRKYVEMVKSSDIEYNYLSSAHHGSTDIITNGFKVHLRVEPVYPEVNKSIQEVILPDQLLLTGLLPERIKSLPFKKPIPFVTPGRYPPKRIIIPAKRLYGMKPEDKQEARQKMETSVFTRLNLIAEKTRLKQELDQLKKGE